MEVTVRLEVHLPSIEAKLDETNHLLKQILAQEVKLSDNQVTQAQALEDLKNQVAQSASVEQSAITLIQGLAAQISAAGTDGTALEAIVQQLNTQSQALADAVAANTQQPSPSPSPTPAPTPTPAPPANA